MPYDSWTCLMVEKGPAMITGEVRSALKFAACDLHYKKWDSMRIVGNDACDGLIETDWKSYTVGARSGILFRAQLSAESGDFLFNQKDLDRGAEVIREMEERKGEDWRTAEGRIPVPELYQFDDLGYRGSKKLN